MHLQVCEGTASLVSYSLEASGKKLEIVPLEGKNSNTNTYTRSVLTQQLSPGAFMPALALPPSDAKKPYATGCEF